METNPDFYLHRVRERLLTHEQCDEALAWLKNRTLEPGKVDQAQKIDERKCWTNFIDPNDKDPMAEFLNHKLLEAIDTTLFTSQIFFVPLQQ